MLYGLILVSGCHRREVVPSCREPGLRQSLLEMARLDQAARSRLISAQRDRVIASFTLLSAVGRLDHKRLGLPTQDYEPQVHYHQVRDAWHGVRTPSGQ